MANLRKLARGRDCQIRIAGICNFNPETTVACSVAAPLCTARLQIHNILGQHVRTLVDGPLQPGEHRVI